jgi:hypothetical protein
MSNGITTRHTHDTSTHHSGWINFAGFLMIIIGMFQIIDGLVGIFKPGFYVATTNQLIVFDYKQWGWINLIFGIVVTMAAFALFRGKLWGRVTAIALATLSAILNFGFIWAYPIWSVTIIIMDILIILAVASYSEEEEY